MHRVRTSSSILTVLAALVLVSVVSQLVVVAFHDAAMAVDDAYISFRYAENLRTGLGLRWNPEDAPHEGYTNLLHVVAIAIGRSLSNLDPTVLAAGLACLSVLGITLILTLTGCPRPDATATATATAKNTPRVLHSALITLAGLGFCLDVHTYAHATRGLETLMFAMWCLLTVACLGDILRGEGRSRVHILCAVFATVLAFLTRPDGVLLTGVAWLTTLGLLHKRGSPKTGAVARGLLAVIVCGLIYGTFKLAYFGDLFPAAFAMKGQRQGFQGVAETQAFLWDYAPLLALFVVSMLAPLARRQRPEPEAILALTTGLAWLVYSSKILHELGYNHRFAFPIVPIVWLAIAAWIARCGRWSTTRVTGVLLTGAALTTLLLINGRTLQHRHWELDRAPPIDPYAETYLRLGEKIRILPSSDTLTLTCSHAGATPYAAECRHIDLGGLTDPNLRWDRTSAERSAYLRDAGIDLCTAGVFPASPGADSPQTEPNWNTPYVQDWLLGDPTDLEESERYVRAGRTEDAHDRATFERMRRLRDEWTLLGEMRIRQDRWRLFVYAKKSSPRHDQLVADLTPTLDIPRDRVDVGTR